MKYTCKRCGYCTERKNSLKIHLTNKKECQIKNEDISRQDLIDELYPIKDHLCTCGNGFSFKTNLCRHQKTCNHYITYNITNNNDNSINNTYNITNNTHIHIHPFGEEDISMLYHKKMIEILGTGKDAILNIVKEIMSIPQNVNIKITDLSRDNCKILNHLFEWVNETNENTLTKIVYENRERLLDFIKVNINEIYEICDNDAVRHSQLTKRFKRDNQNKLYKFNKDRLKGFIASIS